MKQDHKVMREKDICLKFCECADLARGLPVSRGPGLTPRPLPAVPGPAAAYLQR